MRGVVVLAVVAGCTNGGGDGTVGPDATAALDAAAFNRFENVCLPSFNALRQISQEWISDEQSVEAGATPCALSPSDIDAIAAASRAKGGREAFDYASLCQLCERGVPVCYTADAGDPCNP